MDVQEEASEEENYTYEKMDESIEDEPQPTNNKKGLVKGNK